MLDGDYVNNKKREDEANKKHDVVVSCVAKIVYGFLFGIITLVVSTSSASKSEAVTIIGLLIVLFLYGVVIVYKLSFSNVRNQLTVGLLGLFLADTCIISLVCFFSSKIMYYINNIEPADGQLLNEIIVSLVLGSLATILTRFLKLIKLKAETELETETKKNIYPKPKSKK